MLASDIMSTKMGLVCAKSSVTLAESLGEFMHVRHLPVVDSKNSIIGIISIRDVVQACFQADHPGDLLVEDLMTANPVVAAPTDTIEVIAKKMRQANVSCMPIVEHDTLVGIITERDFVELHAKNS